MNLQASFFKPMHNWLLPIALFLTFVVSFWVLNFPMVINDFLGFIETANYLQLTDIATYYNGVYPSLYIVFLKLCSTLDINLLVTAMLLNAFFAAAIVALFKNVQLVYFSFAKFTLFIFFLSFIDATYFKYAFAAGPYMPFVFFVLGGILFLVSGAEKENVKRVAIGALFFGIAMHLRYEGTVFFIIALVLVTIVYKKHKIFLFAFAIALPFFLLQLLINFKATGAFISSAHALFVDGINWIELRPGYQFQSLSRAGALNFYLRNFTGNSIIYILPFLIYLLRKAKNERLILISWIGISYYVFAKIHPSPRALLPIIPLSYFVLFSMINLTRVKEIFVKSTLSVKAMVLFVLLFVGIQFAKDSKYYFLLKAVQNNQLGQSVETQLQQYGSSISPSQIFTNDFDLYLPKKLPDLLVKNGGWTKLSMNTYKHRSNLNLKDEARFLLDLKSRNIRFLLINENNLSHQIGAESAREIIKAIHSKQFRFLKTFESDLNLYELIE